MGRVFVYRNLAPQFRKQVMWSLKSEQSGLVIAREKSVALTDVKFKVSAAGRKRVLATKRKAVHAGVSGMPTPEGGVENFFEGPWVEVTYNPYKYESFVRTDTGEAVYSASKVYIDKYGVWAVL